jgi:hypothetical protein
MPERLRANKKQKIGAYIGKTNPQHIDIPTLRDAISGSALSRTPSS